MAIDDQVQIRTYKWLKTLRGLAIAGVVFGVFMLISTLIAAGIAMAADEIEAGAVATPAFFISIIGIIGGGIGIGAYCCNNRRRKCLSMTHYVFCIISATIDFCYILSATSELVEMRAIRRNEGIFRTTMAMLMFDTFIHMLCSILSTAFSCCNWCCCESKSDVNVVYSPSLEANRGMDIHFKSDAKTMNINP